MSPRVRPAGNTRTQDDDAQYVLIILGMPARSDWRELKDFLRKTLVIRYVRRVEVYQLNIEGVGCGTFDVRGTRDAYRCYDTLRDFGYNNCSVSVGLLREDGSKYETLERSFKVKYTARATSPARVCLLSPPQPEIQSTLQPAIESFLRESISTQSPYHTMTPTVYPLVSPIGQPPAQAVMWNSIPSAPSTHLSDARLYDLNRPGQRPPYANTPSRVASRAPITISSISAQNRYAQAQAFREHAETSTPYRSTGSTTMQASVDSTSLARLSPYATYVRRRPQAVSSRLSSTSGRSPRSPAPSHHPRPQAPEFFPHSVSEASNGPLICDGSTNSSRRPRYIPESDDEDDA